LSGKTAALLALLQLKVAGRAMLEGKGQQGGTVVGISNKDVAWAA